MGGDGRGEGEVGRGSGGRKGVGEWEGMEKFSTWKKAGWKVFLTWKKRFILVWGVIWQRIPDKKPTSSHPYL